jgi:hypothetical protein
MPQRKTAALNRSQTLIQQEDLFMDYGLAFTFLPNSSKNWISKAAMGVLFVLLIPVLGLGILGLIGWGIAIARGVINNYDDVLPEWSQLGPIFIDGLKVFVLIFIWFLPLWILSGINALIDQGLIRLLISCCTFLYGIPFSILLIGAFGLVADDRPFVEALNPMNAYRVISANWANTLIVWLLAAVGYFAAVMVGTILCGIGILIGIPYGYALAGHLYGQLYRESQGSEKAAVA